jgi:hypothetical protein
MKKFCKMLLRRLAENLGCTVIKGANALLLPSSELVRNEIYFRCVEEDGDPNRLWIEVRLMVRVSSVENMWAKYSGRPSAIPDHTCSQQIRRAVYPEYDLPDSGFSLLVDCSEDLDRMLESLSAVGKEQLIPLAQTCLDYNGVLEALRTGKVSAQRFDHVLLLVLANRKDEALTQIQEAKNFFGPENGFEQVNIMWHMFERLQKDLESKRGIG